MWAFNAVGGTWLRWDGANWTAGQVTTASVELDASAVFGTKNVWAFGRGTSSRPQAFHFDGSAWKRSAVPGSNGIAAASAVTSRDIWAVLGTADLFGISGGGKGGGLVHWFRGRWHAVTKLPSALRNASLGSVLARSDKNVWIGGATKNSKHGTTEAIGHWNGHRWTVVKLRAVASGSGYRVVSLVTDGAGGIWALGNCLSSATCTQSSPWRLWHEAGGHWSGPVKPHLSRSPTLLLSLASVAQSVWAPGAIQSGRRSSNGMIALWGAIPH
jgi:hypothetical protein